MKRTGTTHATVVAYLALVIALSGTAVAATGGTLRLGGTNRADATTTLRSTSGAALALRTEVGTPPMRVSDSAKVERLNADQLDSLDSADLQRRITGACDEGAFVQSVDPDGSVVCGEPTSARTYERFDVATADGERGDRPGYLMTPCDRGDVAVGGGYWSRARSEVEVWMAGTVAEDRYDPNDPGAPPWIGRGGYEVGWTDDSDDSATEVVVVALCLRQH